MSLNSVNIMGNLTRDPELRYTPSGKAVCSLSIANNRIYSKNSEKITEVSYFDVEVWGVIAENCVKYLKKGNGIIVEGRLRQDRWEKDGKTQSRVKIAANSIHFMPKKREDVSGQPMRSESQSPAQNQASETTASQDVAWDE